MCGMCVRLGSAALCRHEERMRAQHTDRLLGEDDETFLTFCREAARRCPTCGVIIWRCSGCDHMRCQCGALFSWNESAARIYVGALSSSPTLTDGSTTANAHDKAVGRRSQEDNEADRRHGFSLFPLGAQAVERQKSG